MTPPEDRSFNDTPSDLSPFGATETLYASDDNLDLDAGAEPHDARLDSRHGRKTRQARKDEISNRAV